MLYGNWKANSMRTLIAIYCVVLVILLFAMTLRSELAQGQASRSALRGQRQTRASRNTIAWLPDTKRRASSTAAAKSTISDVPSEAFGPPEATKMAVKGEVPKPTGVPVGCC